VTVGIVIVGIVAVAIVAAVKQHPIVPHRLQHKQTSTIYSQHLQLLKTFMHNMDSTGMITTEIS